MTDCLTDDTLALLVDEQLSPEEIALLHPHLDQCASCHALLVELIKTARPMKPVPSVSGTVPPVSWPSCAPGQRLGPYRIVRTLGAGGMGVVFEGVHSAIGHRVAIKLMHPWLSMDPEFRERFFNEARAVNLVQHPALVGVFEFGQLPGGDVFLVMEYLEGQPLRHRWPVSESARGATLGLLRQIAAALQAVHDKGIVHRDLKPDNVMILLDPEHPGGERAKIFDFGLAKVPPTIGSEFRTRSGALIGTPLYMSPEQCRGAGEVDAKTDVYSLGVMLYEALTARAPFYAAGPGELMAMHMYEEPRWPREIDRRIPASLDVLTRDMLAKSPLDRPSMAEVGQRLASAPREFAPATRAGGDARRRRAARMLGVVALAGLLRLLYEKTGNHAREQSPQATGAAMGRAREKDQPAPSPMLYIPGGRFSMGSTLEEADAAYAFCRRLVGDKCQSDFFAREQPLRQVEISPFLLDATEVTNEQFAAWLNRRSGLRVEAGRTVFEGTLMLADLYPSYGYGGLVYQTAQDIPGAEVRELRPAGRFMTRRGLERKPVVQVSWHAALRYCKSYDQRLPSEAEWEFAARGPQGYRFPWGDDEPRCEDVVFGQLHGEACAQLGASPAAVGLAPHDRTPHGVYDLGGNVSEWVMDALRIPYPACPPPCHDPMVTPSADDVEGPRVVRGGNWYMSAESCRAAARSRLQATAVKGNIGFRCAQSLK